MENEENPFLRALHMSTDSNTVPPRPRRQQAELEKREAEYLQSLSDPAIQAMARARVEGAPSHFSSTPSSDTDSQPSQPQTSIPADNSDLQAPETQPKDTFAGMKLGAEGEKTRVSATRASAVQEQNATPDTPPPEPVRVLSAEQQEQIARLLAKAERIRNAPAIEWKSESQWEQDLRKQQQWIAGDLSAASSTASNAQTPPQRDAEGHQIGVQTAPAEMSSAQKREAERLEKMKPIWYAGDVQPYLKQKNDFEELSHTWHTGKGRTLKSKGPAAVILAAAALSLVGLAPIGFLVALATPIPWIVGAVRQQQLADKIRDNVMESAKQVRGEATDAVPLKALEAAVRYADVKSFDGQLSIQLFKERLEKMRANNEPIPLSSRRLVTGSRH